MEDIWCTPREMPKMYESDNLLAVMLLRQREDVVSVGVATDCLGERSH